MPPRTVGDVYKRALGHVLYEDGNTDRKKVLREIEEMSLRNEMADSLTAIVNAASVFQHEVEKAYGDMKCDLDKAQVRMIAKDAMVNVFMTSKKTD